MPWEGIWVDAFGLRDLIEVLSVGSSSCFRVMTLVAERKKRNRRRGNRAFRPVLLKSSVGEKQFSLPPSLCFSFSSFVTNPSQINTWLSSFIDRMPRYHGNSRWF